MPKQLLNLNPFLDQDYVPKVGGRASLANVSYNVKHPYILSAKAHLSTLIIEHLHCCLLHPGPSLLHFIIRRKFWILRVRNLARLYSKSCVKCRRLLRKPCQPQMANLPLERREGGRAFLNIGINFAEPFLVRESLRRKASLAKAYMSCSIGWGQESFI